jgi:hypothetical protein
MKKFTAHAKRVTLNLARLSTAADADPAFAAVLNKLPDLGWDLNQLPQSDQELLFAEVDADLEAKIKAEFAADPSYLVDLGNEYGVCPLCGHVGCRWLFRVQNLANGKTIECGSECIITHGLQVMGAETAEHARKALEQTIRKAIKKLQIEEWHDRMGFSKDLFLDLLMALKAIRSNKELPYHVRNSAHYKLWKDLPKLQKFYDRSGWLNTQKRWDEWIRLVGFARKFNPAARKALPYQKPHGWKPEAPSAQALDAEAVEAAMQDADLAQQAADEAAYLAAKAAPQPAPQPAPPVLVPYEVGEKTALPVTPWAKTVNFLVFG